MEISTKHIETRNVFNWSLFSSLLGLLLWAHARECESIIHIFTPKGRWSSSHSFFLPLVMYSVDYLLSSLNKEVSSRNQFEWASHESPLKDSWQWSKYPLHQSLMRSRTFQLFNGYQRTWPKNCPLGETVDSTFIGFKWKSQVKSSRNE